jgi:hypothetical protein
MKRLQIKLKKDRFGLVLKLQEGMYQQHKLLLLEVLME